jgi:hypothetical protein
MSYSYDAGSAARHSFIQAANVLTDELELPLENSVSFDSA